MCAMYTENASCNNCNVGMMTRNDCETPVNSKCVKCGRKLIPFGQARINGSDHTDWSNRKYH